MQRRGYDMLLSRPFYIRAVGGGEWRGRGGMTDRDKVEKRYRVEWNDEEVRSPGMSGKLGANVGNDKLSIGMGRPKKARRFHLATTPGKRVESLTFVKWKITWSNYWDCTSDRRTT